MAISIIGTCQGGGAINGGNVTLTFSVTPSTGDHIYIFGGSFTRAAINYGNTGYESLIADTTSISGYTIILQRLVAGASPPTTVVCNGTGNAADGTAYCSMILRGASTLFDATTVSATGSSTNPNAGAITTVVDNDLVGVFAASAVNDTSITAPASYTNGISGSGNDTNPTSAALASRAIAAGGTNEDPASWTTWSTGAWVAKTVAFKPAAVTKTIPTAKVGETVTSNKSITAARAVSTILTSQLVRALRTFSLARIVPLMSHHTYVQLNGAAALHFSVAGGNISEIVTLLRSVGKQILLFTSELITILRQIIKTIVVLLGQTVTRTTGGNVNLKTLTATLGEFFTLNGAAALHFSVAGGNIGEIVTLVKSVLKNVILTSGEVVTLLRNVGKTILITLAEIVTVVPVKSSSGNFITLTPKTAQIVTLLKNVGKTIPTILIGEIVTLTKSFNKSISMTLRQTVTLVKSAGKLILITLRQTVTLPRSMTKTILLLSAETVTLLKLSGKIILITLRQTVTLTRTVLKTILITSAELVTLIKSRSKTISMTLAQIVTLLRSGGKIILTLLAELVTLPRAMGKTILVRLSELVTLTPVGSGTKPIAILISERVTLGKSSSKTILVTLAELILLPKLLTKTILMTSAFFNSLSGVVSMVRSVAGGSIQEILTLSPHNPAQLVSITTFTQQIVTLVTKGSVNFQTLLMTIGNLVSMRGQSTVYQPPIKIIPLDYQYQLPFSYTKPPTNPIYVDDSATLFMVPDEPLRITDRIRLTITAPDGTSELRMYPQVWIGGIDSWGSDDSFATSSQTFAITQFVIGALHQAGYWQATLTYNGIVVHQGRFFIALRPKNIPAPVPLPGVTVYVKGSTPADALTTDFDVPLTDDSNGYLTT